MEQRPPQHFLMVSQPLQGHINPALHLARRLTCTTGAHVTFSTAIAAHRNMFPALSKPDEEVEDGGLLSFIPYSNGYDDGLKTAAGTNDDINEVKSKTKLVGSKTLSTIIDKLAARGRPVTCVIYTMSFSSWAADVAHDHGIPSAIYWIQPATAFAIYYYYFHGYDKLITSHSQDPLFTVNLMGLPPLRIRDLPSFIIANSDDRYYAVLVDFGELFEILDREQKSSKPRILMNTFDAIEADAIKAVDGIDLITIGPILQSLPSHEDPKDAGIFKLDSKGYMEWLDSKPERSVVYVSFGSISVLKKQQLEEISRGLRESGRPYLWVVRKDNREEGVELEDGENGMVVEWCSQMKVLSHTSVGCFVTHCGWNSTLESLMCGVPTVGMPQWSDQGTNAKLAEMWGTGVRSEPNKEGLLERAELKKCLDVVMGEGEKGVEIRKMAGIWKGKALDAAREGGSSDQNLRAFVEKISGNSSYLRMP